MTTPRDNHTRLGQRMRARLLYYLVTEQWRRATRLRDRMTGLGINSRFVGFDD